MGKLKVVRVDSDTIEFNDGTELYSNHESDCCESHWLDMSNLTLEDFDGLEFDLDGDDFFDRIEDYGIALKPINGHPIRIPGYGSNNGYYSCNLSLCVSGNRINKMYDIIECQDIRD